MDGAIGATKKAPIAAGEAMIGALTQDARPAQERGKRRKPRRTFVATRGTGDVRGKRVGHAALRYRLRHRPVPKIGTVGNGFKSRIVASRHACAKVS